MLGQGPRDAVDTESSTRRGKTNLMWLQVGLASAGSMTRQLLTPLKHLYLCADFFFSTQKTEEGSIAMVGLQILASHGDRRNCRAGTWSQGLWSGCWSGLNQGFALGIHGMKNWCLPCAACSTWVRVLLCRASTANSLWSGRCLWGGNILTTEIF